MLQKKTKFGLEERTERVLAYLLLWVSGIILFLFEKNRTVRWHAAQSMVTFGGLTIIMFAINLLKVSIGWIPILGDVTSLTLSFLGYILVWVTAILWVWLMFKAWHKPDYRLPYISKFVALFV